MNDKTYIKKRKKIDDSLKILNQEYIKSKTSLKVGDVVEYRDLEMEKCVIDNISVGNDYNIYVTVYNTRHHEREKVLLMEVVSRKDKIENILKGY